MPDKKWKVSDLWTDAQGKLDEKRVLGWLLAIGAMAYFIIRGDVNGFVAGISASAGFFGISVAADQGK